MRSGGGVDGWGVGIGGLVLRVWVEGGKGGERGRGEEGKRERGGEGGYRCRWWGWVGRYW